MEMIEVKGLDKKFRAGSNTVTALDNVDLKINKGDFALIKGPSGCGKSTLLFAMGGLLVPSSGAVRVSDKEIYSLSEKERLRYRSRIVVFVFQSYYFIPYLSITDNILLLNKVDGIKITMGDVRKVAERLNIHQRLDHKPSELSVGEKQRASLLRALVVRPSIILADEPTGNLDPENAAEVLRYLHEFQQQGGTVVMVTHGSDADAFATRQINMRQGKIRETTKIK